MQHKAATYQQQQLTRRWSKAGDEKRARGTPTGNRGATSDLVARFAASSMLKHHQFVRFKTASLPDDSAAQKEAVSTKSAAQTASKANSCREQREFQPQSAHLRKQKQLAKRVYEVQLELIR